MKSKAMIPLVLGVLVGLVAIKFVVNAVQNAQGTQSEVVTTVVARVDIPASYEITPEMLKTVTTPKTPLIPEGSFDNIEAVKGRVSAKSIPQGGVVSAQSLAPPGTPPGLTERIPEGHRAVSVKIDEVSGVAFQVTPGDYVDVIVVMKIKRGRKDETISRIILQRVKVLAVGQNLGGGQESGQQKLARSVTLLVSNTDVPKLHLAQTQGTVTLAMRGADDRLMADESLASTAEWEQDPEQLQTPAVNTDTKSPADMLSVALGRDTTPAEKPVENPFAVTVFNGPIRAEGTAGVQRILYEGPDSMKVVEINTGRSTGGNARNSDSAETIMRPGHAEPSTDLPVGVGRSMPRSGDYGQLSDREISE